MMYDPPSGWKYGFPKPYLPRPEEAIEDTLRRDGYPEHEIENIRQPTGGLYGVRFFGAE